MNEFEFDPAFSPWELALSKMKKGSSLSAVRFLALLEQDQTVDTLAQALVDNYEVEFDKAKEDVVKYIEPLIPVKAIME